MINSSKILGIAMIALFIASATCLVSARPVPDDCVGVVAVNRIPEVVNVTSYYGNETVCESFLIQAHEETAPSDGVAIIVPKNGRIDVNGGVDSYQAQNDEGKFLRAVDVVYVDDNNAVSRGTGRKIGFAR